MVLVGNDNDNDDKKWFGIVGSRSSQCDFTKNEDDVTNVSLDTGTSSHRYS